MPQYISQLRSFLGLASYYHRFIEDFGKISSEITAIKKTDKAFIWTDEEKRAFTEIKHFLTNLQILAYPDFSATSLLNTHASDLGVGAVVSQKNNYDLQHPIAYYRRGFNKHEKNIQLLEKSSLQQ